MQVPAANPPTWTPGSASLTLNTSGPTPGDLGPGRNYVGVTPSGALYPIVITIDLPTAINFGQVQLYLFQGNTQFGWSVLNDGMLIASGVVPAP